MFVGSAANASAASLLGKCARSVPLFLRHGSRCRSLSVVISFSSHRQASSTPLGAVRLGVSGQWETACAPPSRAICPFRRGSLRSSFAPHHDSDWFTCDRRGGRRDNFPVARSHEVVRVHHQSDVFVFLSNRKVPARICEYRIIPHDEARAL